MLFYNKIHFASIFVCQVLFMGCFPLCRCSGWFSEVEKQKVSLIMWWRSDSLEIIYTPNCQFFVSAPRSPQTLPKSPIHSILLVLRCFFQKMRSGRLSQWLPSALKAIWVSKTSQGRWAIPQNGNSLNSHSLPLFPEHGYDSLNRLPVFQFFANNKKKDRLRIIYLPQHFKRMLCISHISVVW